MGDEYLGEDRRKKADPADWRASVDAALEQGRKQMQATDERLAALENEMVANTEATKQVQANTSEMVGIMQDWKGAMKVLGYVGAAAKPLAYIVGFCTALYGFWAALKSGGHFK